MSYIVSIPQQFSKSASSADMSFCVSDTRGNTTMEDVVDHFSCSQLVATEAMRAGRYNEREFLINGDSPKTAYRKIILDIGIEYLIDTDISILLSKAVSEWAGYSAVKGNRGSRSYIAPYDEESQELRFTETSNDVFPETYEFEARIVLYIGTTVMYNHRRGATNVGLAQDEVIQDLNQLVDKLDKYVVSSGCELKFTYEDNGTPVELWF